ncbi:signal transduction histidine kinase [Ulvibacter sp. MAR_2010_11]|uniref:ATP-binding protein n=1 Tax=Ulvibacter sp. MAR_2010_11 TaxID=1250229 RepID=UPI000C2C8376|nr:sensor histidine kinase [Ulvibacter sp. MAR_2010_11]PKA82633.1 signal transduction histidine kinase [Ulvibacter sp. MAR_2010_11]
MITTRKHSFQPGARSIIQMGEELIGHPTSAINELVKNGYDADATKVNVYINIEINVAKSFVFIIDNGVGMADDVLFGEWLQPSVSSKRKKTHSEIFNRKFLGNKGIGRLAAMALGQRLTVISKTSDCINYNWLSLDSNQFQEEVLLNRIEFPGDEIINYKDLFEEEEYLEIRKQDKNESLISLINSDACGDFLEGTLIIIENVDASLQNLMIDEFSKNENELKFEDTSIMKSLGVLITPLAMSELIQKELIEKKIISNKIAIANENSTFQLNFGTNLIESNSESLELHEVTPLKILKGYSYRAIGKVDSNGKLNGFLYFNRLEGDNFPKNLDFDVSDFNKIQPKRKEKKETFELSESDRNKDVGEFIFDIRIYDREKDAIEKLGVLLNEKNSETKNILNKLLGIRISKNGFGVKPYGDVDGVQDWLGLGQKRVQDPGKNIGPNLVLGYVYLFSPQNDGLKEKTNREGFYENKAFNQLKGMLLRAMQEIGQLRYNYRLRKNLGRPTAKFNTRPESEEYLRFINDNVQNLNVLNRTQDFIKETNSALDNAEFRLSLAERLASLGSSLELLYHELAQPITILGAAEMEIYDQNEKVQQNEIKNKISEELNFISEAVSTLDDLKDSLEPAIGKSVSRTFKPIISFSKVMRLYKKDISDYDIKVDIDPSLQNYQITDNEYALWISFLNIINNAIFWLKTSEENSRTILFSLENNNLVISNTGPLIPEDIIDIIFEYGVSNKPGKNKSGLGLTYTKSILDKNKWSIHAENRDYGPAFIINKLDK